MDKKTEIIAQYTVPQYKLIMGLLIDIITYPLIIVAIFYLSSGIWEVISGAPVEAPTIGFMSAYSKPAQNGYWLFVSSAIACTIILSALLPTFLGASIGKTIVGLKLVNEQGNHISIFQTMTKTVWYIGLSLLLYLPGPTIGFSFQQIGLTRDQADVASLIALIIGIFVVLYLMMRTDKTRRTLAYRIARIVPILKEDEPLFKEEINALK